MLSTLDPLVNSLSLGSETKSLLVRSVDSKDERKKIIQVTASGIALKQDALSLKQVLLNKVSITEQQIDSLRDLCLILTDDLNKN